LEDRRNVGESRCNSGESRGPILDVYDDDDDDDDDRTDLKEIGYADMDGINLAQDRVKWLAVVNLVSEF
jgi:hypothetical protein